MITSIHSPMAGRQVLVKIEGFDWEFWSYSCLAAGPGSTRPPCPRSLQQQKSQSPLVVKQHNQYHLSIAARVVDGDVHFGSKFIFFHLFLPSKPYLFALSAYSLCSHW